MQCKQKHCEKKIIFFKNMDLAEETRRISTNRIPILTVQLLTTREKNWKQKKYRVQK